MKLSTAMLHGGYRSDPTTGSIAVPIYQSAAFEFESAKKAADLFFLKDEGFIYSRMNNPTVDILEKRLALLEGGKAALAVSSGQSAAFYAVCNLAQAGDNIVASPAVYGGIFSLFANSLKYFQIEVRFADPDDPQSFAKLTDDKTRAYYAETLPNPRFKVFPIEEVANVASEQNIPLIIDNTCTPTLCRPFEYGANIVIYSTTKYIGGHGTTIGGCIIENGKFDWKKSGKRQLLMNQPDPTYDGVIWSDLGEQMGGIGYLLKARTTLLRDFGSAPSPHDAFFLIQGLETLTLRMQKHCENAQVIAEFLNNHPQVSQVVYPSLAEGQDLERSEKYLPKGKGGMMGVHIHGEAQEAQKFTESLKVFYHAANLGDARSLAIHPASTTHSQMNAEQQKQAGISANYVRLSIGIEDTEDLMEDLNQALSASQK